MVKLVGLIRKRSDLTTEAFRAHWLGTHATLAQGLPGLRRYRINFIDPDRFPGAGYDGFSELWFDSQGALDAAFAGPVGVAIEADIPRFMDALVRTVVEEHEVLG